MCILMKNMPEQLVNELIIDIEYMKNIYKKYRIHDIEYYPEINTKMGLDSERPQELIDILKNKKYRFIIWNLIVKRYFLF